MKHALVLALVALATAFLFTHYLGSGEPSSDTPRYLATVKIQAGKGHGSGTHIGNGFLLTAAHVIDGAEEITVKSSIGSVHKPEILWENKAYDVALLRVSDYERFEKANLECRTLRADVPIIVRGNPLTLDFTSYRGHVNGSAREISRWKSAVPVDATIVPGISGGGVYDTNTGNLVGIAVGAAAHRLMMNVSLVPIGIVVPGSIICQLMGRA